MKRLTKADFPTTPFVFLTGKGGVGKTSVSCALAISMAREGKKVLLISTDPASNLQDVFQQTIYGEPTHISDTLYALNINPEEAAAHYKEQMIQPYRGKLPPVLIQNMEEQLSGACTVEIAAFNEFAQLLTDQTLLQDFDHIIFDTAPTGHTLRLLQLPSAWTHFLDENTTGTSCLGPLKGLNEHRDMYRLAVERLMDKNQTTLWLVTRPDGNPLKEAARASQELDALGMQHQQLIINGYFEEVSDDVMEHAFANRQRAALQHMPHALRHLKTYTLPYVPYTLSSQANLECWLRDESIPFAHTETSSFDAYINLEELVQTYTREKPHIIFTMGKGGVGKTTVASYIAMRLAEEGQSVHLTTTDPAAHLSWTLDETLSNLTMSRIDPKAELAKYEAAVLEKAEETMTEDGLALVKEDLASPCTEEIAVFRAFAEVVKAHEHETIIIDTAPTGHTLLLLDATEAYHQEVNRTQGEIPPAVSELLPKLRDSDYTRVLIVSLPEATPVLEAARLQTDLERAGLSVDYWVMNQCFTAVATESPIFKEKQQMEQQWLEAVQKESKRMVVVPWLMEEPIGQTGLKKLEGEVK